MRERNKLTQNEMANFINVSRKTYVEIESAKTPLKVSVLFDIAKYLGCSVSYLLDIDDNEISTGDKILNILELNGYKISRINK